MQFIFQLSVPKNGRSNYKFALIPISVVEEVQKNTNKKLPNPTHNKNLYCIWSMWKQMPQTAEKWPTYVLLKKI